jgi:phosphatidylserine/phosphatidylglycerophosphate/cardiolipin synthase-like enzyme
MAGIADWFLTGSAIEKYRTAYTVRNQVYFEREGDQYFGDLDKELGNAERGMRVLLAGWRFSPEQRLAPLSSQRTVVEALRTAQANGATIRVLEYGSAFATSKVKLQIPGLPSKDNADFAAALRKTGMEAVLDDRLAEVGSQHQKAAVVARPKVEDSVAYVGGIDLCVDRYDTVNHVFRPERQIEPPVIIPVPYLPVPIEIKTNTDGWHDVQAAVRGPAVGQVWQALAERWNDPAPIRGRPGRPIPAAETPEPPETPGTMAVQVLRTLPCNGIFRSQPKGERTVLAAYEKAIRRAEHFIYIEDQYFWPSPVTQALQDAVRRGVRVVAMVARDYDLPLVSAVHKEMRARTAREIAQPAPENFRIFHKERLKSDEAVYVHAKVMIIDDVYLAVGSANLNFRSHTNDSELHLGLYDEHLVDGLMAGRRVPVGEQIRELRQNLWAEHLAMEQSALIDPVDSLQRFWPDRPGRKVGQAVWHDIAPPAQHNLREELRLLLRLLQVATTDWEVLAAPLLASSGIALRTLPKYGRPDFDLGSVADLVQNVSDFIEHRLFNPELVCR